MEKGGVSSMDASVGQDVWDWEVLPDGHRSFYAESRAAPPSPGHGVGQVLLAVPDKKLEEPLLPPPSEADECKDIGVVPAETQEEHTPMPPVSQLLLSDSDDGEKKKLQSSDNAKEAVDDGKPVEVPEATAADPPPHEVEVAGGEEGEEETKKGKRARPECVVFSVGKLRVNGIGALCSFGVAAATVCVFLVGGKLQHQQKQQHQQNIQLQFLGDDKRIQQVVQQTSRLNQAVSSMMGAGASTRAKISFGGFYDGF